LKLYVRETWCSYKPETDYAGDSDEVVWYRATDPEDKGPWKSSRCMPRRLGRIPLEVAGVRAKLLQKIHHNEVDLRAEGTLLPPTVLFPRINAADKLERYFADYWDSLNAKRGYGWDVNPFVWVLSFRRLP